MSGFSLSWLHRERAELIKDRLTFGAALDMLKKRITESNESNIPRRPLLHEWSGTRSVVGSLEMSLHAIERSIDEIDTLILAINNGDVDNLDKVDGGDN